MRFDERATALIEVIVVGFAVVSMAIPTLLVVLHLSQAETHASIVATDTATWIARHGSVPETTDDVDLDIRVDRDGVVVRVRAPVRILGVRLTTVEAMVERSMDVAISPYRSDR